MIPPGPTFIEKDNPSSCGGIFIFPIPPLDSFQDT